MNNITRVEVISQEGREFVAYYSDPVEARAVLQDGGSTLKIFLDKVEIVE